MKRIDGAGVRKRHVHALKAERMHTGDARHYHRLSQRMLRLAHAAGPLAGDYIFLALAFDRLAVECNIMEKPAGRPSEA